MSVELKPCPFCGGEAIVDGCDDTLWIVICKECNASIGHKGTEQEAIDAWNRRIEPTFTPATMADSDRLRQQQPQGQIPQWWRYDPADEDGAAESRLGRVAYGVADRVDRLKAIGNGQVPLVAATAFNILMGDF